MDSAFQFLAATAAGSRMLCIFWDGRAWLAANAEITSVVLRQVAKPILGRVLPHLPPRPISQQADFRQSLSAGQMVFFKLFQVRSRRRLLASQPREPKVIRLECLKQRLNLAQLAAF